MKKYILPLVAAALVLYLHLIGMEYSLYFYHWWYDVMMHFLGGFAIASFLYIFTNEWKQVLVGMLIIATGWEIFEFVLHIELLNGIKYVFDTIKDFVMDTLGALLVIYLYKK